jgi:hypothetical protein
LSEFTEPAVPTVSQLIITDPVLRVRRLSLDGRCRLTYTGGSTGSVVYESISAKESTTTPLARGRSRFSTPLSVVVRTAPSVPAVLDMTLICGRTAPVLIENPRRMWHRFREFGKAPSMVYNI